MSRPTPNQCFTFRHIPSMNPVSKEYFDFESAEYKGWALDCDIKSECGRNNEECKKRFRLNGFCPAFEKNPFKNPMTLESLTDATRNELRSICGFAAPAKLAPPSLQDFLCNVPGANPNCITRQVDNATLESIRQWMTAQQRYIEALSLEDKKLIEFYETSDMYEWNAVLRDGKKFCNSSLSRKREAYGDMIGKAQRLYNLIMDAPRTPDMFLFRGERVKVLDSWDLSYDKINTERPGFTSASLAITEAAKFASGIWTGSGYQQVDPSERRVLAIRCPVGTPALCIAFRQSNTFDERLEVVLPPHILEALPGLQMKIDTPKTRHGAGIYGVQYAKTDVKTFVFAKPLKIDFPDNFNGPSISQLIEEFVDFAKKHNLTNDPMFQWVVKGGFGINTLLEHKYKMKNLVPSLDLDIGIYYDSNNVTLTTAQAFVTLLVSQLKAFTKDVCKKYKIDATKFRINGPSSVGVNAKLYSILYSLCGDTNHEGLIDVAIEGVAGGFDVSKIDKQVTDFFGLPVKTAQGYLEEVKDLLKRSIYLGQQGARPGQPGYTYGRRNPISGLQKEKGLKALDRATLLCKADSAGRTVGDYVKMCQILAEKVVLGDTLKKSEADLEKLFRDATALD
jgi:hypothetical protein